MRLGGKKGVGHPGRGRHGGMWMRCEQRQRGGYNDGEAVWHGGGRDGCTGRTAMMVGLGERRRRVWGWDVQAIRVDCTPVQGEKTATGAGTVGRPPALIRSAMQASSTGLAPGVPPTAVVGNKTGGSTYKKRPRSAKSTALTPGLTVGEKRSLEVVAREEGVEKKAKSGIQGADGGDAETLSLETAGLFSQPRRDK